MKKILFFAVAAATVMALTDCSQSSDLTEVNATTGQNAISFETYLATNTRAGVSGEQTTETIEKNGFGVLGYYTAKDNYAKNTAPNFMYNTKVTGTTNGTTINWTYTPLRYWPNDENDKLSFFAYAPYIDVEPSTGVPTDVTNKTGITAITNNNYSDAPTVSYTLADTKTQSVDLLWGVKKGTKSDLNTDLTRIQANTSGVGFTFKHALAKFGGDNNFVKAILVTDDDTKFDKTTTKVTISDIKIESSDIATTGTFDLTTGQWSTTKSTTNGTMSFEIKATDMVPSIAETSKKNITGTDAAKLTGLQPQTTVNVLNNNTISSFYLIPGTQPTFKVTVTYWVRTIDPTLHDGVTNVQQTITKAIQFPNAFEVNKKYNLILSVGLNTVNFTGEIASWDTTEGATTTTVDLPEVIK